MSPPLSDYHARSAVAKLPYGDDGLRPGTDEGM